MMLPISDLFSQKDRLWDGFCMKFLQGLYIALWSLLLVIPGIVKTLQLCDDTLHHVRASFADRK